MQIGAGQSDNEGGERTLVAEALNGSKAAPRDNKGDREQTEVGQGCAV